MRQPLAALLLGSSLLMATTDPFDRPGTSPGQGACELATAVPTTTIRLEATGVSPRCIVVSAGDLVTWVNPLSAPVTVRAADDQLFTEDVSSGLTELEVPPHGSSTVRVIHAGRVEYTAPDQPEVSGTILVLGHGSAA
jgi:plastocyanin